MGTLFIGSKSGSLIIASLCRTHFIPYLFGFKTGFSPLNQSYEILLRVLPFLNSPKDLDLSYKMELVFGIVLE